MPRLFRRFPLITLVILSLAMRSEAEPLKFEVYATSEQVDSLLGSDSKRAEVLRRLREFRIGKVYLETVRSGHTPDWKELRATRDFLRANGIEVAGGLATVPGPRFGVGSTGSRHALNYEAPETREALRHISEQTAAEFDEMIVDDFLMTDDESDLSKTAKGDRAWSEYRLELMAGIARDCILAPARARNPKIRVTIKYPQWYDRFHVYGYHVLAGPELFDTVWVGTETRNPDTPQFGYTQPTEGFINYSWLASIGGQKVRGAWFDTIECNPDHVYMQAAQSILAGAKHLTLFNLADIAGDSPLVGRLKANLDFLKHLEALVGDRKPGGLVGYKPPHSDPGIDVYVHDFLTTLGIPVRMTATPPEKSRAILLAAQAASDPNIAERIEKWLEGGSVVVFTPGFVLASRSPRMAAILGYPEGWDGTYREVVPEVLVTSGVGEPNVANVPALDLPVMRFESPNRALTLCVGIQNDNPSPPLLSKRAVGKGTLLFLNIHTYEDKDFSQDGEMYLSPNPLTIPRWPKSFVDGIRAEIPMPIPVTLEGAPPFGAYFLGTDTLVLTNFKADPAGVTLRAEDFKRFSASRRLEAEGSRALKDKKLTVKVNKDLHPGGGLIDLGPTDGDYTVTIPPWDLAALEVGWE